MYVIGRKAGGAEPSPLDLKSQIFDMELQGFVLGLLAFSPALVWYFLTVPPFLPSGMVIYILCHLNSVEIVKYYQYL